MMQTHPQQHWQLPGALRIVCMLGFFVAGIGSTLQAQEQSYSRKSAVDLDSEIQAIKSEILEINSEILLLEESALYPRDEQIVVFVSIPNKNPIIPEMITLRMDGRTVAQHVYSEGQDTALLQGSAHRLYTGRLDEGEHQLDIALSGSVKQGKTFQRKHSITLNKSQGAKTVELQLGTAGGGSKADVVIREWQ